MSERTSREFTYRQKREMRNKTISIFPLLEIFQNIGKRSKWLAYIKTEQGNAFKLHRNFSSTKSQSSLSILTPHSHSHLNSLCTIWLPLRLSISRNERFPGNGRELHLRTSARSLSESFPWPKWKHKIPMSWAQPRASLCHTKCCWPSHPSLGTNQTFPAFPCPGGSSALPTPRVRLLFAICSGTWDSISELHSVISKHHTQSALPPAKGRMRGDCSVWVCTTAVPHRCAPGSLPKTILLLPHPQRKRNSSPQRAKAL